LILYTLCAARIDRCRQRRAKRGILFSGRWLDFLAQALGQEIIGSGNLPTRVRAALWDYVQRSARIAVRSALHHWLIGDKKGIKAVFCVRDRVVCTGMRWRRSCRNEGKKLE